MRTICWSIGVVELLAVLGCHPPQPVPTTPPTTPVNPTNREVAEEFLDASIVADASLQADVILESSAIPARTY
jgi:hypothetical protein